MRFLSGAAPLAALLLVVAALSSDVRAAQCGLVDGETDGSTEHDSDGDGVPDCLDSCPVLANAPTDTDEDGIPDGCDCDLEVDTLVDETDGECEIDCAIRDAIVLATPGCTLHMPAGVLELAAPLTIDRSVSLIGAGADATSIHWDGDGFALNVGHASSVVEVYLGALAIEHSNGGGLNLGSVGLTDVVLSSVRIEGGPGSDCGASLFGGDVNPLPHTLNAGQAIFRMGSCGVSVGRGGTSAPSNVFTCRHCLIEENEGNGLIVAGGFHAQAPGKGGSAVLLDSNVRSNGTGAWIHGAVSSGGSAGGTLSAERTVFTENANHGVFVEGGFLGGGGASAALTRCEISSNQTGLFAKGSAGYGGGGSISIFRSAVHSNVVSGVVVGGNLNCSGTTQCSSARAGSFTAQSSTIAGNYGSGIRLDAPAGIGGGSAPAFDPTANLSNTTVIANQTGVSVWDDVPQFTGKVTLNRSVVASNNADCDGPLTSTGFNFLESAAGCTINAQPTDLIGQGGPALLPFGDYGGLTPSAPPVLGSPVIDAAGSCSGTDQRDVPRPFGSACDMGAAEYAEVVLLDRGTYACEDSADVTVLDAAMDVIASQEVTVRSTTEPAGEQLTLPEVAPGHFTAFVALDDLLPPASGDGIVSVADGDTLTVEYLDVEDGEGGGSVLRQDSAVIDCPQPDLAAPFISNVSVSQSGGTATITWTTNEPSDSFVGFASGSPEDPTSVNYELTTQHQIATPIVACRYYSFSVRSTDAAGNQSMDDNGGLFYSFVTPCAPGVSPIPDGRPGTDPVTALKFEFGIRVLWDRQCVDTSNFVVNLFWGPLTGLSSYEISGSFCGFSPFADDFVWLWSQVPSEDVWFLLVEENETTATEGSWGESSFGERNGTTPSGVCGVTNKDVLGQCL